MEKYLDKMSNNSDVDLSSTWQGVTRDRCDKCDGNETKRMSPNELLELQFKKAVVNFTDDNDRTTNDFGIVNMANLTAWSGGTLNSKMTAKKVIYYDFTKYSNFNNSQNHLKKFQKLKENKLFFP